MVLAEAQRKEGKEREAEKQRSEMRETAGQRETQRVCGRDMEERGERQGEMGRKRCGAICVTGR